METMCSGMRQLRLAERSAISLEKFEPEYVLYLDAQSQSEMGRNANLASTSSKQTIRVYSRETLALRSSIKTQNGPLIGIKFSRLDGNTLYSSSENGKVECWDLRMKATEHCAEFIGYEESKRQYCSFDVNCTDQFLCVGTSMKNNDEKEAEAHLMFWDHRYPEPLGVYKESHSDDITQVKFHPSNPDKLLSGSTDGLVCMYDISESCEEDALLHVHNTDSSVAKVGWFGAECNDVYCLTHIETLQIFKNDESVHLYEDIRSNKKDVDYLIDCFTSDDSDQLVLLAGNNNGHLHLLDIGESIVSNSSRLIDGHNDIVRCLSWDNHSKTLVTGGEDAMLCLWTEETRASTQSKVQSRKSRKPNKMFKLHENKEKSIPYRR